MDTLGCAAAIAALAIHVLWHPRMLRVLEAASQERPGWARAAVLGLAAFALVGGVVGYHRDWPRWANGRAIVAIAAGALIGIVALLDALRIGS